MGRLPFELEHEIFLLSIQGQRPHKFSHLLQVARRVNIWLAPHVYKIVITTSAAFDEVWRGMYPPLLTQRPESTALVLDYTLEASILNEAAQEFIRPCFRQHSTHVRRVLFSEIPAPIIHATISTFQNIEHLSIWGMDVAKVSCTLIAPIQELKNLRELSIHWARMFRPPHWNESRDGVYDDVFEFDYTHFESMTRLTHLNIISDGHRLAVWDKWKGLAHMRQLRHLELIGCRLNSAFVRELLRVCPWLVRVIVPWRGRWSKDIVGDPRVVQRGTLDQRAVWEATARVGSNIWMIPDEDVFTVEGWEPPQAQVGV